VLDSVLEPVVGVELPREVFISRARWMSLIVEWNASANMFYLLKNLLLLIMVIFKLKCNNLIFNEIMVFNASYVCLHAFSLHRESSDPDPERRTSHFWGGSVTRSSHRRTQQITRYVKIITHNERKYMIRGIESKTSAFLPCYPLPTNPAIKLRWYLRGKRGLLCYSPAIPSQFL
jgi:hypothetical protein